jgi:hypothetical protein
VSGGEWRPGVACAGCVGVLGAPWPPLLDERSRARLARPVAKQLGPRRRQHLATAGWPTRLPLGAPPAGPTTPRMAAAAASLPPRSRRCRWGAGQRAGCASCAGAPGSAQAGAPRPAARREPLSGGTAPADTRAPRPAPPPFCLPQELVSVIEKLKPDGFEPKIVSQTEDFLYVEYSSPLLGFIDDVEFWFKPGPGSRVEYRCAGGLRGRRGPPCSDARPCGRQQRLGSQQADCSAVGACLQGRSPPPARLPPLRTLPTRPLRPCAGLPRASASPTATSTASASRPSARGWSPRAGAPPASERAHEAGLVALWVHACLGVTCRHAACFAAAVANSTAPRRRLRRRRAFRFEIPGRTSFESVLGASEDGGRAGPRMLKTSASKEREQGGSTAGLFFLRRPGSQTNIRHGEQRLPRAGGAAAAAGPGPGPRSGGGLAPPQAAPARPAPAAGRGRQDPQGGASAPAGR